MRYAFASSSVRKVPDTQSGFLIHFMPRRRARIHILAYLAGPNDTLLAILKVFTVVE